MAHRSSVKVVDDRIARFRLLEVKLKSRLTHIEKQKLEREFGMDSGYVLDFSNRTFEEFFREVVGVEIYHSRFDYASGSKANRMRAFWKLATNEQLIRLFEGLLEGWDIYSNTPISEKTQALLQSILVNLGAVQGTTEPEQKGDSDKSLNHDASQSLLSRLLVLTSLPPQRRGYEFEKFLRELFDVYGLSARASFRLVGEQIDGSCVIHNNTYLLEAKWQSLPSGSQTYTRSRGNLEKRQVGHADYSLVAVVSPLMVYKRLEEARGQSAWMD